MRTYWKSVAAGAVGGLAGALAMSGFQFLRDAATRTVAGRPALDLDREATIDAARVIARLRYRDGLSDKELQWLAGGVQCSLGTALGAVYGCLAEKVPFVTSGQGAAYGFALWLAGDEIAVPAMGLAAHGPARKNVSGHVNALASHLVYGVVTSITRKLILDAI